MIVFFSPTCSGEGSGETAHGSISPERVVEIQLRALQQNDAPSSEFGIAQTWAFAHPNNKRMTGPLERFKAMIKGPRYRMMLNHREHKIKPVVVTEGYALFDVFIVTESELEASFQMGGVQSNFGNYQGCWMTIAVSPPIQAKFCIGLKYLKSISLIFEHCRGYKTRHLSIAIGVSLPE